MNHNYSVEVDYLGKCLNPETFGLGEKNQLTVTVYVDGQHDGRLWNEKQVWHTENELIDKIMQTLRVQVEKQVRIVKPFSVHGV